MHALALVNVDGKMHSTATRPIPRSMSGGALIALFTSYRWMGCCYILTIQSCPMNVIRIYKWYIGRMKSLELDLLDAVLPEGEVGCVE